MTLCACMERFITLLTSQKSNFNFFLVKKTRCSVYICESEVNLKCTHNAVALIPHGVFSQKKENV